MCTDNCGWVIVAAKPQAKNLEPVFATTFDSHMKGSVGSTGHTGCHTLYRRATTERQFEQDNGQDKKVSPAGCSKIYSAKVKLPIGTNRRGEREWGAEKLSSFWPDDMCLECVTQAIKYSWKYYKAVEMDSVKHKSQSVQIGKVLNVAAWAGEVNIKKGTNSYRIWVGSPEEGTTGSPILSAYPKIGTQFF